MIFVTIGTHEQPFDRLIKAIDDLKADGTLTEDVIIQTGYSTYIPKHCKWQKLFPYSQMVQLVDDARIVITHGGPSSFIMALQVGKRPIVVPRMQRYGEHVNDHQVFFCRKMAEYSKDIVLVEDITRLREVLAQFDELDTAYVTKISSNNMVFNEGIQKIVEELLR